MSLSCLLTVNALVLVANVSLWYLTVSLGHQRLLGDVEGLHAPPGLDVELFPLVVRGVACQAGTFKHFKQFIFFSNIKYRIFSSRR